MAETSSKSSSFSWPTNADDPSCPVSSAVFYDNDGNKIDNTHIHDNRYYPKWEVDNIVTELRNDLESKTKTLSGGKGLKPFDFDGSKDITINLDFLSNETAAKYGSIDKAARVDHFHEALTPGDGLISFKYDGSKNTVISVLFEGTGVLTSAARSDHYHESLIAGNGLVAKIYNGSEVTKFDLDFLTQGEEIGLSDKPARSDHYHKTLRAGNGLVAKTYNGSTEVDFSISYAGYNGDFGISTDIARSDHLHDATYTPLTSFNTKAITDVSTAANNIVYKNNLGNILFNVTTPYSERAGKLNTSREIKLTGDANGSVLFDGSKNVQINTEIEKLNYFVRNDRAIYSDVIDIAPTNTNVTLDLSLANIFEITLNRNITLTAPNNAKSGMNGFISLYQDTTGNRTVAFDNSWTFVNGKDVDQVIPTANWKTIFAFIVLKGKILVWRAITYLNN